MLEKANLAVQEFSFPAFEGDDLALLTIKTSASAATDAQTDDSSSAHPAPTADQAPSFITPQFSFASTPHDEKELQRERLTAKKQSFKIAPMVMQYRGLQQQEDRYS